MNADNALLWIHALSPLRIGVEQSLDAINLPTMREVHTDHPIVPGSSLKGTLRAELGGHPQVTDLFGPDRLNAADHRGALAFGDARVVALPVRSLYGTFAWVTSPYLLRQLERLRAEVGLVEPGPLKGGAAGGALVCDGSALRYGGEDKVFIEEYAIAARLDGALTLLARRLAAEIWPDELSRTFFVERLVLLPDTVADALLRNALELRTRVAINAETGTVETSGPWTEEALPAETLLCGLVQGRGFVAKSKDGGERKILGHEAVRALRASLANAPIRLGGHNGIGYGRAQVRVVVP